MLLFIDFTLDILSHQHFLI